MSSLRSRRNGLTALAALCFASQLYAQTAPATATCTTVARGGGLPPGTDEVYTGTYGSGIPYRTWQDLCYGDAVHWQEWISPNTWANGQYRDLVQRFDLYLPQIAQTRPVPLVIYAHPMGQTENLDPNNSVDHHFDALVGQAMAAGFAVASIEFRHPVMSFVDSRSQIFKSQPTPPTQAPIPNDDISTAVRYMRFLATDLRIAPADIFVVGQSRGSMAILNALSNAAPLDPLASDWRSRKSKVNAVVAYQAQTTYRKEEVGPTFIDSDGKSACNKFGQCVTGDWRTWFNQDYPPLFGDPGSAASLARAGTTALVPMRISYDNSDPNFDSTGTKPIVQQCYDSNNQNRAIEGLPPVKHCLGPIFDVHDPKYGQYLYNAYVARGQQSLIKLCEGVGKDNVDLGFKNYIAVFTNHLSNVTPGPEPACPAN